MGCCGWPTADVWCLGSCVRSMTCLDLSSSRCLMPNVSGARPPAGVCSRLSDPVFCPPALSSSSSSSSFFQPPPKPSLACWSLTVRRRRWRSSRCSTTTRSGSPVGWRSADPGLPTPLHTFSGGEDGTFPKKCSSGSLLKAEEQLPFWFFSFKVPFVPFQKETCSVCGFTSAVRTCGWASEARTCGVPVAGLLWPVGISPDGSNPYTLKLCFSTSSHL